MLKLKMSSYRIFYEELRDVYFEKYFKNSPKGLINSTKIWIKTVQGDGRELSLAQNIFKMTSDEYLYRKYKDNSQLEDDSLISFRAITMLACCKFLKLFPSDRLSRKASNEQKANDVWQQYEIARGLKEADRMNETLRLTSDSRKPDRTDGFKAVKSLLRAFYQYINAGKYFSAWKLMHPQYQFTGRWKGDYFKFISAFVVTHQVSEVQLFDFSLDYASINATFFCKERYKTFPISNASIDINETKEFLSFGKGYDYDEFVPESGIKKLHRSHFKRLTEIHTEYEKAFDLEADFDLDFAKNIYFDFARDRDIVDLMFPNTPLFWSPIQGECSFEYFENEWLIQKVSTILPELS